MPSLIVCPRPDITLATRNRIWQECGLNRKEFDQTSVARRREFYRRTHVATIESESEHVGRMARYVLEKDGPGTARYSVMDICRALECLPVVADSESVWGTLTDHDVSIVSLFLTDILGFMDYRGVDEVDIHFG